MCCSISSRIPERSDRRVVLMFDGLKKKFSSFIESLSNKEAENEAVADKEARPEARMEPGREIFHTLHPDSQHLNEAHKAVDAAPMPRVKPENRIQEGTESAGAASAQEPIPDAGQKPAEVIPKKEPKVSTTTRIKGLFLGHVKISEKDADPFIESLKLGLLQSDVNYDVADKVADSIRRTLVGREVSSRSMEGDIRQGIRDSIMGVLTKSSEIDIVKRVNAKQLENQLPYKILFVGPNGAGKTTTMAKMASMLIANNISCVLSASDTFRAAAIEQTAYHASKLGINVIKGAYGADPASVAFDAIAHAKAHGIMVVLIDSAGRQETNKSLIEELEKISRVTSPISRYS